MKHYSLFSYTKYKNEVKDLNSKLEGKMWDEYTKDELVIKFMPLVEHIARKFSTTQQASGILDINDLIQEGNVGLVLAINKLDWEQLNESANIEQALKSFLSKRIKGNIRRALDINRGSIRLPENKLNQIRKDKGKNEAMVELFFSTVFSSIDEHFSDDTSENPVMQIEDKSSEYKIDLLNGYLMSLMKKYLDEKEYEVLRLSYGLDCNKLPAIEIANRIDLSGSIAFVRVSEIKRKAIQKLIKNVDASQVIDFL
jgi:RNA polymerase sigma factor (sigma-70 family)